MNLAFKVASQFVRRKNSRFPSFTAVVSVLGVAIGVASFLVVVTVFNSFQHQLRQILLAANPNLVVYKFPRGIPQANQMAQKVAALINKPVEKISLFEYNEVILSKGDRTAAVVMRALEGENSASAPDLSPAIAPHKLQTLSLLNNNKAVLTPGVSAPKGVFPAIILGKILAVNLGAQVGDHVSLVSGGFGSGNGNRFQEFVVVGTMELGLEQYDKRLALITFPDGVALFGEPGWAKGLEVRFKDPADALAVSKQLNGKIPYTVRAWQEIDRDLFSQIERDGEAIKLIVLIITLVAGFNIIVTLSLSVIDRAKQIATLRSFGATRFFIVKVFVIMGAIIGVCGATLGLLIGTAILRLFAGFELGELQAFYFLERIPVEYDIKLMLSAFAVALVLSFVSALYPALKATRVSPLLGLKPQF